MQFDFGSAEGAQVKQEMEKKPAQPEQENKKELDDEFGDLNDDV